MTQYNSRKTTIRKEIDRSKDAVILASVPFYSTDLKRLSGVFSMPELELEQAILRLRREGKLVTSTEERSPTTIHVRLKDTPMPFGRTITQNWWK